MYIIISNYYVYTCIYLEPLNETPGFDWSFEFWAFFCMFFCPRIEDIQVPGSDIWCVM